MFVLPVTLASRANTLVPSELTARIARAIAPAGMVGIAITSLVSSTAHLQLNSENTGNEMFPNVNLVLNICQLIVYLTVPLPSRTQSLKAAIVFDRDVTVKASSKNALNLQNLIKTVKFLVSTLFFSRTMCLGFTITA
jgi:hypothetical protein